MPSTPPGPQGFRPRAPITPRQPPARPPTQAQDPAPENGARKDPRDRPLAVGGYYDIQICAGTSVDEIIRVSKDDYHRLGTLWMLLGEDVCLQAVYDNHEVSILLRGHEGGKMTVSRASPARKAPRFSVRTAKELRDEIARKAEEV